LELGVLIEKELIDTVIDDYKSADEYNKADVLNKTMKTTYARVMPFEAIEFGYGKALKYFEAPDVVFEANITGLQKLILLCLYREGAKDSVVFPSIRVIASKCGIGRITAIKAIRELRQLGMLNVTARYISGGNNTNMYSVNLEAIKQYVKRPQRNTRDGS
jgi:hypothetical protein